MELVKLTHSDGIATLTLNRPEKLNALNQAVLAELRAHLERLATDDTVRCVILTGSGRSFSAGHDLKEISNRVVRPGDHPEAETIDILEQLPVPTIAKVRGHCLTGGLELALACDFIIASDDASFADTHSRWGLVPVWGMSIRLPERVGAAFALEMMFTARSLSAEEAERRGLVNRAVAGDALDATVEELAAGICTNSPGANRIMKRLVKAAADVPREKALLLERCRPFGMPPDEKDRVAQR